MSLLVKSLAMWLVLLVAMTGNGFFRVLVLQPRLGEPAARQAASALAVVIVITLSALFVRTMKSPTRVVLVGVGCLWLLMTVAFEFLFGHYVSGASWATLMDDYDLARGRLWPLVLLATLVGPWLSHRVGRGQERTRAAISH